MKPRPTYNPITPEELSRIVALMRKPRTAGDVARATGMSEAAVASRFYALETMGKIRRAERIGGMQIWEAAP